MAILSAKCARRSHTDALEYFDIELWSGAVLHPRRICVRRHPLLYHRLPLLIDRNSVLAKWVVHINEEHSQWPLTLRFFPYQWWIQPKLFPVTKRNFIQFHLLQSCRFNCKKINAKNCMCDFWWLFVCFVENRVKVFVLTENKVWIKVSWSFFIV